MFLIALILISLIVWIYRNSETQYTKVITEIEEKNYIKSLLIEPNIKKLCSCKFIVRIYKLNKEDRHQHNFYNFSADQLFIIVVTSYVGHVELRSAHRRAMPTSFLKAINVTRIFLLAKIPKQEKYSCITFCIFFFLWIYLIRICYSLL